MQSVVCQGLTKQFDTKVVLDELSFQLPAGRVLGLLGKNGAGKTTLLRTLMGIIPIESGKAQVLGAEPGQWSDEVKGTIGYVPQRFYGFDDVTAEGLCNLIKPFYPSWDDSLAESLLDEFALSRSDKIGDLSEGEKQLISIVLAMAFRPKLLVLDEPVASLDPASRRVFLEKLIENHCEPDTSVIFSTHITSDLERIASDLLIIKEGRAALAGELETLRDDVVRVKYHLEKSKSLPTDELTVLSSQQDDHYHQCLVQRNGVDIAAYLQAHGASQVRIEALNLEELFLELHQ